VRAATAKDWIGDSVELDAIPPNVLRQMVQTAIERHLPPDHLAHIDHVERIERETLAEIIANWTPETSAEDVDDEPEDLDEEDLEHEGGDADV